MAIVGGRGNHSGCYFKDLLDDFKAQRYKVEGMIADQVRAETQLSCFEEKCRLEKQLAQCECDKAKIEYELKQCQDDTIPGLQAQVITLTEQLSKFIQPSGA